MHSFILKIQTFYPPIKYKCRLLGTYNTTKGNKITEVRINYEY